jgi:Protein of unknown function (DUF998)
VSSRWLLACGVVAGPLFTLAYVLAGSTRPDYSWRRHPVSSLALGPDGWIQSLSFVASGLLLLAFTWALGRAAPRTAITRWGARLMGAAAVVLVVAGAFVTDPVSGYPPGTPARPAALTMRGTVHAACALVGFVILVAAMFVFARAFARRRERGWTVYSLASGVVTTAAFALTLQAISQKPGWVELGGLFERVAFIVALGWVTAIAWRSFRAA